MSFTIFHLSIRVDGASNLKAFLKFGHFDDWKHMVVDINIYTSCTFWYVASYRGLKSLKCDLFELKDNFSLSFSK